MENKPTASELEILGVLWSKGAATVREVNEALNQEREIGYTTTLKLMQIMAQKGLVARDETSRTHIYKAAIDQDKVQATLLNRLVDSAFSGSASSLVMQALGQGKTSKSELEAIKKLIEKLEGGQP
ncbi:MAG: transcriptional regulator [Cytophagales bacterium CG12_big_fil_rev_8_21_14_0_65_40_12]|nr:MAG: transcriptional regulator [Cytophagales bacterium CG12_big_fil_rev_8_21_14_0_65_40_12]PIW04922.1 MAG: transcriptional regulator [Cytophagales bacterium CG17_big_fil_post_rev_8_21_14_2_50_40_13]